MTKDNPTLSSQDNEFSKEDEELVDRRPQQRCVCYMDKWALAMQTKNKMEWFTMAKV